MTNYGYYCDGEEIGVKDPPDEPKVGDVVKDYSGNRYEIIEIEGGKQLGYPPSQPGDFADVILKRID